MDQTDENFVIYGNRSGVYTLGFARSRVIASVPQVLSGKREVLRVPVTDYNSQRDLVMKAVADLNKGRI